MLRRIVYTAVMSDSYLDHIPSQEREKIRKRMRSPEAYERLRDSVKGPEDLEREMEKNADFAEVKLTLETEPGAQEKARNTVQEYAREQGADAVLESLPRGAKEALKKGNFDVTVDHTSHEPRLAITLKNSPQSSGSEAPMGNIAEALPLKPALQQQILASFVVK